jgi:uncharacterized protein (DUF2141 family)
MYRAWSQPADEEDTGVIVVSIDGFRRAAGHARIALFAREAGFQERRICPRQAKR